MRPSTEAEPTSATRSHSFCLASILPVAAIRADQPLGELQVADLAAQITQRGLVEPICVVVDGPDYHVVHDEQRFAAVKKLGWIEVPAQVVGPDNE
jgi:ParB-like chromosome segregation protein Spo0J